MENISGAFTSGGFRNWRKPTEKLSLHAASQSHAGSCSLSSMDFYEKRESDYQHQQTVCKSRAYLKCLISILWFCCRQALPLRRHRDVLDLDTNAQNAGNFIQLVKLLARSDEALKERLETGPQNAMYLHHDIQDNESNVVIREKFACSLIIVLLI